VVLYFCVRIRAGSDAIPRLGACSALATHAAIPKIILPFKKRWGFEGEAAEKEERKFLGIASQPPINIINYHGIFHNGLYNDTVTMADKHRVKYQKFIKKLRQARLEAGLTQVDVGKELKQPQAYISKTERGERRVDVVELHEFAKLYKKPLEYFLK